MLLFLRAQDLFTGNNEAPLSEDVRDEQLGTRRIADVETTGRRITMTIPAGVLRNDKPVEMVDERWESRELHLLISAHFSDSRLGNVEYQLTNLRRVEPLGDLFVVPPDYRIDRQSTDKDLWQMFFRADRYPALGFGIYGRDVP